MRPGLFFLPFLALVSLVVGTSIGSAYAEIEWLSYSGIASALIFILIWIILDIEGLLRVFRRKGTKYGASSGIVVLLGIVLVCAVAFLSTRDRFNFRIDLTEEKINSLSDQSRKIVKQLTDSKAEIEVVAFFRDLPQQEEFRRLLGLYKNEGNVFRAEYLDPVVDPLRAQEEGLTTNDRNVVILKQEDRNARISVFNEERLTNAIIGVIKDKTKKVYFTSGHGEPQLRAQEPNGYDRIVKDLESSKYEVEGLSILETGEIPKDTNLLVIAGPKYDFKPQELTLIEEFVDAGGSLLVLLDALTNIKNITSMLAKYGVEVNEDFVLFSTNDPRVKYVGQNNAIIKSFDEVHPITRDFADRQGVILLLPFTRTLGINTKNAKQMYVESLAKTSEEMMRLINVNDPKDTNDINEEMIERDKQHTMLAVATGKTGEEKKLDVKLVVAGSSFFARNQLAEAGIENRDFMMNLANFLLADEDFISIRPKNQNRSSLDMTSLNSTFSVVLISLLYPFIFLGGGVLFWLVRRRA